MKKAVIYGRVSTTDKQEYDRQIYDLERYAKGKYKVVETFTEKISGRSKNRPEYDKMLAYLKDNPTVNNILVTELSRFGRLGTKTKLAIEELAEAGVNIYFQDRNLNTLDENGKPNSDTMLIIGILCDIAKKELETFIGRIKSGLEFSASQGGAISGKYDPFGFKNIDKKLVVDKGEMKTVVEIFNLYDSGLGCSQIAKYLNSKNVKTKYNKVIGEGTVKTKNGYQKKGVDFSWSSGQIAILLKKKLYRGERWHKGVLVNTFEPPVNPKLFDSVQIKLKGKNNRPIRQIINDNHLKGLIKCGVCGESYTIHKRKDGKDNAYKCLTTKYQYDNKKIKPCGSPSINIDKLLDSLYQLSASLIIRELRSNKSDYLKETEKKIQLKDIEVKNHRIEIKKLEKRIDNLYDDYNERLISKSIYVSKKNDFEKQIEKNEALLSNLMEELTGLEELKKNPVHNQYTKEQFYKSIRSLLSRVTIGIPQRTKRIDSVFGEKSVNTLVTVTPILGNPFQYILSRYSKKVILLDNGKTKLTFTLSKEAQEKGYQDMMYEFVEKMNEIYKKKLK